MVGPLWLSHNSQTVPNSWCQRVVNMWTRRITTDFPFPSSKVPLIKNKTKEQRNNTFTPLQCSSQIKVTFKIYISGNKSCSKSSFIYSYTENGVSDVAGGGGPDGFFTCKITSPAEHKGRIIARARSTHKTQQPWASVLKGSTFTGFSNEFL